MSKAVGRACRWRERRQEERIRPGKGDDLNPWVLISVFRYAIVPVLHGVQLYAGQTRPWGPHDRLIVIEMQHINSLASSQFPAFLFRVLWLALVWLPRCHGNIWQRRWKANLLLHKLTDTNSLPRCQHMISRQRATTSLTLLVSLTYTINTRFSLNIGMSRIRSRTHGGKGGWEMNLRPWPGE
jgi:hypothetical protein